VGLGDDLPGEVGVTLLPVRRSRTGRLAGISLLRALRKKEMVAFVIDAGVDRGGAFR
jgi:hypothetical protein